MLCVVSNLSLALFFSPLNFFLKIIIIFINLILFQRMYIVARKLTNLCFYFTIIWKIFIFCYFWLHTLDTAWMNEWYWRKKRANAQSYYKKYEISRFVCLFGNFPTVICSFFFSLTIFVSRLCIRDNHSLIH
jgi:hypothetical protein